MRTPLVILRAENFRYIQSVHWCLCNIYQFEAADTLWMTLQRENAQNNFIRLWYVWRDLNCIVTMVTDTLLYVGAGAGGFIVLVLVIAALIIVILCRRWVFVLNVIKQQLLSSKCDWVIFILRKSELKAKTKAKAIFILKYFYFCRFLV